MTREVEITVEGTVKLGIVLQASESDTESTLLEEAERLFSEHVTFDEDMPGEVVLISTERVEAIDLDEVDEDMLTALALRAQNAALRGRSESWED